MKKIFKKLGIFGSLAAIALVALCSYTGAYVIYNNIPRTAGTPYNKYVDNSYRVLSQAYDSLPANGTSGNGSTTSDSLTIQPNSYYTLVYVSSVTDTLCLFVQDTTGSGIPTCFKGDILEVQAVNSSTGVGIKFQGSNWAVNNALSVSPHGSPGALIMTASKRGNITLRFDGKYWCEISRNAALTN